MSPTNTAGRPAYKVEELLALRASASESRVSLEKFPDEEVIKEHYPHACPPPQVQRAQAEAAWEAESRRVGYQKRHQRRVDESIRAHIMHDMYGKAHVDDRPIEHVVRRTPSGYHAVENVRPSEGSYDGPSNGGLAPGYSNRNRLSTAPPNVSGPATKRPSPTPSVKRNMAEQLIAKHGSPPHLRVTAGGRIVPNDLQQLGSPRVPYTPPMRYSNPGSARMPHALPNGMPSGVNQYPQGYLGYDPSDNYGQPMYQITPPNIPFPQANQVFNMMPAGPMPGMMPYPPNFGHENHSPVSATAGAVDIEEQLSVSRAEYERVRQEKIELERHEVKASDQLSAAQRQQIVAEKRKYVMMLDTIRKKIKDLETVKSNGGTSVPLSNGNGSTTSGNGGHGVSSFPTPVYNMGGIDGAIGAALPGQHWPMQPVAGPFPMPWNAFQPAQTAPPAAPKVDPSSSERKQQPEPTIESPASEPSPSSRAQPRRSHAVQIVDPNEGNTTATNGRRETYDEHMAQYQYPAYKTGSKSAHVGSGEHPSNLNPASPSYEPGKPYPLTEGSPPHFVVPAPTPIETPNPPPAELAKHWVFSQQHAHSHAHTQHMHMHSHGQIHGQEHGRMLSVNGSSLSAGVAHQQNGNGNGHDGPSAGGHVIVSDAVMVPFSASSPTPRAKPKQAAVDPEEPTPTKRRRTLKPSRPLQEMPIATEAYRIINDAITARRRQQAKLGDDNAERSSQRPTSHSSVTTTDFFPTNTHEHSFNKYMSRKASGAGRLSMEANPCTSMRDPHSGVVSPMTDHLHPPAPPVSPAAQYGVPPHLLANSPEDMRLSSFLRDTARVPPHPAGEEQVPHHSPVRAETRDEFHGKSRPYLEGYLAGSSGHAPSDPKNKEYCAGYIDGLAKTCLNGNGKVTRESSTISLKSETISVSRTPPNTTDNRSLIVELAGTAPGRAENVRSTQSLNFSSPPSGSNHPGNEPVNYGGEGSHFHPTGTSHPPSSNHTKSRVTSGTNFTHSGAGPNSLSSHLPRSWSEDNGGAASPNSSFHRTTGPWNVPSRTPMVVSSTDFAIAQPQSAIISSTTSSFPPAHAKQASGTSVNRRVISTSVASQPSLTGYSGNHPSARVGSIPQDRVFGDDKYVVTSTTTTVKSERVKTSTTGHENQRSVSSAVSRTSGYDGTMEDLQEMRTALPAAGSETKHAKNTSSIGTGYPTTAATGSGNATPRVNHSTKPSTQATPSGSPTKSTTTNPSPKKSFTSPRHFGQKIKDKVTDMMDRSGGAYCGGNVNGEASGAQSRAESPDPKMMSPEEKKRWKDGWRSKLGVAKGKEEGEIRRWRREGGGSGVQ